MKKGQRLIFLILFLIYTLGVGMGVVREIKTDCQEEMYTYLESAVTEYNTKIRDGVKSVATENGKLLALLLLGGTARYMIIAAAAGIFLKGYASGFSVMAALRLFGLRGLVICGANLLSVAFLVPASIYFSAHLGAENFVYDFKGMNKVKKYIFFAIFLITIFCADSYIKTILSTIFMKCGAKLI